MIILAVLFMYLQRLRGGFVKNFIVLSLLVIAAITLFDNDTAFSETLTLPEGLRSVTQNNRLIKIALSEEAVSEADTLLARSAMLPNVNASLSQTLLARQPAAIFGPQAVPISERGFLSYSLNVQQVLYDFKASASRYEASKAVLRSKELDTKKVRGLVALNFALSYFDLLETEKMRLVAEKEVQRLESHLKDAKSLYKEGVITKNDLLQAEVRLSDSRQKLLSMRNLRSINASRLNNLLARPLNTEIVVLEADNRISAMEYDLTVSSESALKNRPEIHIIYETMNALKLDEASKEAEFFPRFFVKGSHDYTENRYQVHEANWSLTFGMSLNIFSGGSTKAELLKIRNRNAQLLEQKARVEDEVRLEVEKYYLDFQNAGERINVTKDAVEQAEENLRINNIKYKEGVGTATDVTDAVTLFTIAETNYQRALYDFRRAEAAFLYSMGSDLTEVYK